MHWRYDCFGRFADHFIHFLVISCRNIPSRSSLVFLNFMASPCAAPIAVWSDRWMLILGTFKY